MRIKTVGNLILLVIVLIITHTVIWNVSSHYTRNTFSAVVKKYMDCKYQLETYEGLEQEVKHRLDVTDRLVEQLEYRAMIIHLIYKNYPGVIESIRVPDMVNDNTKNLPQY